MTTEPGSEPSFKLNWCTTWYFHLPLCCGVSSNTTPLFDAPPLCAVPHRLPLASKAMVLAMQPCESLGKSYRMVSFHLPSACGASLKITPQPVLLPPWEVAP